MTYESQAAYGFENLEDAIVSKMWEEARGSEFGPDGIAFNLRFFEPLHKEVARGMLRALAERGVVHHMKGLWNEDGEPRGAGYALTIATCRDMKRLDKIKELPVDTPWEQREAGKFGPAHLIDQPFDATKEYGGNGSIPF